MLKYLLPLIFSLYVTYGYSQNISIETVNSTGGYVQGSFGSLEYSVGEIATTTEQTNLVIITQGFLQPDDVTTSTAPIHKNYQYSIYPNPTTSGFMIESDDTNIDNISIYNNQGQLLRTLDYTNEAIDISTYSNATYWIRLHNTENQLLQTFQILKIN